MRLAILTAFLAMLAIVPGTVSSAHAASAGEIEAGVNTTLDNFRKEIKGGSELMAKAQGVLVFPKVLKAGFGVGGEYGEGALRQGGKTTGYYSTASASIGFQIGAQVKSVLIFFMTEDALSRFKNSDGWQVGADASVAVINEGLEGSIDSDRLSKPIVAFVIGQSGLMAGVSLEGAKVSKINR